MPTFKGGKLRRKGCSLVRRTHRHTTAAWRLLYRLLFMVTRRLGEVVTFYGLVFNVFEKRAVSQSACAAFLSAPLVKVS